MPCDEWGALPPRHAIERVGKPSRTIFHHTAGHHPNLDADSGESFVEGAAYARAIQRDHMQRDGRTWADSGHNFLVCRSGFIYEGRHGSVASILAGMMVRSAHCVGQNDQPGIEHEQMGNEGLTPIQRAASVWLHSWIGRHCAILASNMAQPHGRYNPTDCPGRLKWMLPDFRADLADAMAPLVNDAPAWYDRYGPKVKPAWFFKALQEYARRLDA